MSKEKDSERLSAIEFFSGIGAFRSVAGEFGLKVVAAYDQSDDANDVYYLNFAEHPLTRNLDTISGAELPDADFWWMSPPCKPFSRRGNKGGLNDPRSAAFQNLIHLIAEKSPRYFSMENVEGFAGTEAESLLLNVLGKLNYKTRRISICPSEFGIPMQRPRLIYMSSRTGEIRPFSSPEQEISALSDFLREVDSEDKSLELGSNLQSKFFDSLNIVSSAESSHKAICFTSGYGKSLKAAGSFIQKQNGKLRHFSPEEILALLGFPESFRFPADMSLRTRWRLAGNSVYLRSIRAALSSMPLN